jgi:hypothetical protein
LGSAEITHEDDEIIRLPTSPRTQVKPFNIWHIQRDSDATTSMMSGGKTSRLSRLIPSVAGESVRKTHPAPPDTTFELNKVVDEPDKIYATYLSNYKMAIITGYVFLIGSMIFPLVLPIEIGEALNNINKLHNKTISQEDYDEKWKTIRLIVLSAATISVISTWI